MVRNTDVVEALRSEISESIRFVPEGSGRFRVSTPFTYDDGDGLRIASKRHKGVWFLSDEGSLLMRLSLEIEDGELDTGPIRDAIGRVLSVAGLRESGGELRLSIRDDGRPTAVFSFIQALLRIDRLPTQLFEGASDR